MPPGESEAIHSPHHRRRAAAPRPTEEERDDPGNDKGRGFRPLREVSSRPRALRSESSTGRRVRHVFRDPNEEDRVWVLFDWDAEGWQNFVSDPEVPAILQEAGHKGKPQVASSAAMTTARRPNSEPDRLERAAGCRRGVRRLALVADRVPRQVVLGEQDVRLRRALDDASSADMLDTSSRCSWRNQCRNCSPTRSFSSRASAASAAICSVTRFSCSSASATGAAASPNVGLRRLDGRDRDLVVGVEQVLDDHHRVVPLLDRLPVEVRGQQRQRLGVEPDRDRDVLLRGGELVRRPARSASRGSSPSATTLSPVCRCILRIHADEEGPDRRRGRARLPQLQRRLPRTATSTRSSRFTATQIPDIAGRVYPRCSPASSIPTASRSARRPSSRS